MVHDYNLLTGINHEGREPFPKSYERVARSIFEIFKQFYEISMYALLRSVSVWLDNDFSVYN